MEAGLTLNRAPTTILNLPLGQTVHCIAGRFSACTIRCAGPMQYNAKCSRHLRLRGFGAKLGSPEIIVNRLTPAWRFFPSKRALDYLRGYAAQASSGGLGGRWRAGARAVELGGGELDCALPLLQKQDKLRADQRLAQTW